VNSQRITSNE